MAPSRDAPEPGPTWRMFATVILVALVYAAAALPAFLAGPVWGAAAVAAAMAFALFSARAGTGWRCARWTPGRSPRPRSRSCTRS